MIKTSRVQDKCSCVNMTSRNLSEKSAENNSLTCHKFSNSNSDATTVHSEAKMVLKDSGVIIFLIGQLF